MLQIPRIYAITDTRISGLTHLEQVKRMVAGGAGWIQLRDKEASSREFYNAAVECIDYARPRGVRILINDRVDIALASQADGVHLGQDDMPPAAARTLLPMGAIIGTSTHSATQAIAAGLLPVDYVAIGPVFPTLTKENPDPVVGLAGVAAVRKALKSKPVVAIGGIQISNLAEVFAAGADSVALIGAILNDPDGVTAKLIEINEALNNTQN